MLRLKEELKEYVLKYKPPVQIYTLMTVVNNGHMSDLFFCSTVAVVAPHRWHGMTRLSVQMEFML